MGPYVTHSTCFKPQKRKQQAQSVIERTITALMKASQEGRQDACSRAVIARTYVGRQAHIKSHATAAATNSRSIDACAKLTKTLEDLAGMCPAGYRHARGFTTLANSNSYSSTGLHIASQQDAANAMYDES